MSDTEIPPTRLLVTDLPTDCDRQVILDAITEAAGEPLRECVFEENRNQACVEFSSIDALYRVLCDPPVIQNTVTKVDIYCPWPVNPECEHLVELCGIRALTDDTMWMYFENARRSGGGQIDSVWNDYPRAYIKFADKQAARRVAYKFRHVINGVEVQASYPVPVDPSETPAPVDSSETPEPVDPSETPAPVDPSEIPAPVDPSETPAPVGLTETPALVDPAETPAPVDPSETPAPVDPAATPAPVEPSEIPAPVEPSEIPAPVDPSEIPAPVDPSEIPSPVDPSEIPAPVDPSEIPAPVDPSEIPAPVDPSETHVPVDPSETPVPVDPSETPAPVDQSENHALRTTLRPKPPAVPPKPTHRPNIPILQPKPISRPNPPPVLVKPKRNPPPVLPRVSSLPGPAKPTVQTDTPSARLRAPSLPSPVIRASYPNIRVSQDKKTCCGRDSCWLPDGGLLVADWDNCRLKRLNSALDVVAHLDLPDGPYAVCYNAARREAAVSLPWEKLIQLVSVEGAGLTLSMKIKLGEICWGVVCRQDELWWVAVRKDGDNYTQTGVYIMDWTSGKCKEKIVPRNEAGKVEVSWPWHLAVSDDGDRLYITSYGGKLYIIHRNGALMRVVEDLAVTRGVCLGDANAVFVSGNEKGSKRYTVFQYDREGRRIRELVTHEQLKGEWPKSVSYNGEMLAVTLLKCDYIAVFQLK